MNTMNHCPNLLKDRHKHLALTVAITASFLLALPSCCLPKLQKAAPSEPLPNSFNGATTAENSAQIGWREFFNDPTLTGLVEYGLAGNQELKILTQRVRAANYEILARRGAYLPFIGLRGAAGFEKPSLFTPLGTVEDQLQPIPGRGFPEPLPNFLVATEISWEIDIWRKLRNARDAATLRFLGTQEGQAYIVTRMVADVAENYYQLMALDNTMLALDKTIQIQQKSLEMSQAKKVAGRETELAVQRFAAEVQKNQSEKLIILQKIIEIENKINFTLGRYPQPVERVSANYLDLKLQALSMGMPSQLLQNRADIRQAERELAAAGLDVRVARARFYPSLNLNGTVGYEAFNTKYLFLTPESLIYGATGDLVAPLINRAAIKADYLTANAVQLEKIYEYQRTVLNAFTEVINRLSKVENYSRSIDLKKMQLQSLEASVDSATKLFQNARAEYMDVLLAQRDMMDAKMVLIETKQEQLSAIINAYQALGGGQVSGADAQMIGSGCIPVKTSVAAPRIEPVPAPEPTPQTIPAPQPLPAPEALPEPDLHLPDAPIELPKVNRQEDKPRLVVPYASAPNVNSLEIRPALN
jgi:NodT family efflux transporter outer membrane factor (OMF) lipoprotein